MMLRALKIRLYPNGEQTTRFNRVLGCYRFVYNQCLERKMNAYKDEGASLGLTDLSKWFHGTLLKDDKYAWLREQNTKVMKQSIRQMLTAYANFFKLHRGFPKFKSKHDTVLSALFPIDAISKRNTFDDRKITLTGDLSDIRFRCSKLYTNRLKMFKDGIRSATLSRTKTGKYFLSVLMDIPDDELVKFKRTGNSVGIDLGVKDFVITSDGEVFENKHFLKRTEHRIKVLQKQLSRKAKGSNNRFKQRIRLATAYERLGNQREAYIHYVVDSLLKNYDTVFMEDLNVKGMLKNHKLAKAIAEVGLYRFRTVLTDKATVNHKSVVFVNRFYPSSKTCSVCGYVKKDLTLNDREWTCPECGTHHDRDLNASINILNEGKRIVGVRSTELTPVDCPTMDDRSAMNLKSSGRMKQEGETDLLGFSIRLR
jgi:putative transposase